MDKKTIGLSGKRSIVMEDIKFKFLGLLNKHNQVKIPSMGLDPDLLNPLASSHLENTQDKHSEASQSTESEAIPDQEILESIEKVYFESKCDFDHGRYELEKLPKNLNPKELERYYKKLKRQHQVVSKKVLQLILQQQKPCIEEFEKILAVEERLQDVLSICRIGRADLDMARKQFTTASLGILANYRKRQIIQDLLQSFNTIKTLQRTEDRVQELLNEANYPGAISLLLECQSAAQTYKHFHCVTALNGKLQDTLEQAEQALDATLARTCCSNAFDVKTYASVQEAYQLLGKPQVAMDQLHMHLTAAIHNGAFTAVHSFVGGDPKRQFKQLCKAVPEGSFIPCLLELCSSLWCILSSYHHIICWHKDPRRKQPAKMEANLDEQYVKQKLENGLVRIWNDVEAKISTLLTASTLTNLKFEQLVQILSIVNRLMEIGEKLYSSKAENLQESMRQQCLSYFSHYHALRLDELRIFLENDGWELCPVKPTFKVSQLQEFKNIKHILNGFRKWNSTESASTTDSDVSNNSAWLQKCLEDGTSPFAIGLDETIDEDILTSAGDENTTEYFSEDSEDDVPEELTRDFVEESEHANKKRHKPRHYGPMVTNTTLSVLRVCGRYLQMIRLLRSIAMTVIQSMIQLFELYFYAVHAFFASHLMSNADYLYSPHLKLALAKIKDNLIMDEYKEEEKQEAPRKCKVKSPHLSPIVNLARRETLFALAERAAAVESLVFLGQQYESFKFYLDQLTVNSPQRNYIQQFYVQTIASARDLRKPVYMVVASQAIDTKNVLQLMSKVNWQVGDVMSQHSNYVDVLLQDIQQLHSRLADLGNHVPLPKEVHTSVWENVAQLIAHVMVEGFSAAKKCSNGGRALMQLDYTQLASKFESLTTLRPMPYREYVESYIKAFYLPEPNLETWIKERKEYTPKHLIGLVSCVCQSNKKSRQRLVAMIEDQRPNR